MLSTEEMFVNLTSKKSGMKLLIENILHAIGEDPRREGLLKTPERVEKSLKFLTSGYDVNIDQLVNDALYNESYDEMVIVKNIDFYSLCEHHMLPFFGKCHVAYLPNGKIIGLSKVPRLVDAYGRRLQVQERLTTQIAHSIENIVKPTGVGVVIEATHLCMSMRGVEKQNSYTTTSSMLGSFKKDPRTRAEFLSLLTPTKF
jgi:GTP cyclohydrolase I